MFEFEVFFVFENEPLAVVRQGPLLFAAQLDTARLWVFFIIALRNRDAKKKCQVKDMDGIRQQLLWVIFFDHI